MFSRTLRFACFFSITLLSFAPHFTCAEEGIATGSETNKKRAAERGYDHLVNNAYLIPDFHQRTIENIWKVWPAEQRKQAAAADADKRREMIYDRYGFTPRPAGPESDELLEDLPLQYVVTDSGQWVMNCFACHGGEVAGKVIPGLPNTHYAIQTLTEETRLAKPLSGESLSPRDLASMFFPMGGTVGTTNAVMFGVALENYRDEQMNVVSYRAPPQLTHHDMDAPAWWHWKKKQRLYSDGFVQKDHRALMPFVLIKTNDGETVRSWETEFQDIAAYLNSLEAPAYPFAIDQQLAERGQAIFESRCSDCHGTYGENETYDPPRVPLEDVGTDPVRLRALTPAHRQNYASSWLGHHGDHETIVEPDGYLPPPLDGIWATAPYLHNGSVPTLWHLLNPDDRPTMWRRVGKEFDQKDVGFVVETPETVPEDLPISEQRRYFQTSKFGKSAAGHYFFKGLSVDERRALLEYLKTL
ncbi:MAG: cytochrome c [Rubinisphaera brasiliensis]|uniref:c-type cytochrome n=1 Tax=Rubinisphaera brasiliensis TaxID=119 RepID=UPI00391C9C01